MQLSSVGQPPREVDDLQTDYRMGQKSGPQTHSHNSIEPEPIKKFSGRFFGKFLVILISKIPSHFAHVATLPCETLVSEKQATNDKLQGNISSSSSSFIRS